MKQLSILLLAAGESKRMGTIKQLLAYQKSNLLQHAIDQIEQIDALEKFVIIGANADEIISAIDPKRCCILKNSQWKNGLGNSIALGVQKVMEHPNCSAVMIVLADMPYIHQNDLQKLISNHLSSKKSISASRYPNNKAGVPAIFNAKLFKYLSELQGDKGATKILQQQRDQVNLVSMNKHLIDIDTPEDYEKLQTNPLN